MPVWLEMLSLVTYLAVGAWHNTKYFDPLISDGSLDSAMTDKPLRTFFLVMLTVHFIIMLWPVYLVFKWLWRGE